MLVVVSEMSAAVSTLRVMMVIIMTALADLPTLCGMITVAITALCAVLSILRGGEREGVGGISVRSEMRVMTLRESVLRTCVYAFVYDRGSKALRGE